MRKVKIVWSELAKEDLKAIKAFIGRNAPRAAEAFIARIKDHVKRLEAFPESGQVVEEYNKPNVREILYGNYRIIYRFDGKRIEVITVYHSARLLDDRLLERN